ncbi:hypothetical protein SS50377_20923 [Spironucleus salmonicida]|uniref:Uncharacterized protein n=1 Tax=Spironucleus salmonicida TaxID=348837 RepID=V6LIP9_9EUKA|nr:hypothetical protein SS50377_20923 [Spironucleus salmonicida]|eukprot:EST43596.1 Hypothetical protein SS50377_16638 [Spironucleus salmonicida]
MESQQLIDKSILAIKALSTQQTKEKASLFDEAPIYQLVVFLQNKPQNHTFQFATPSQASDRALVINESSHANNGKTFEECKVLFRDFKLRQQWLKQYSAIITTPQIAPKLEKYFGAKFLEKRPIFTVEDENNPRFLSGAIINGTQFSIPLGSLDNSLNNIECAINALKGETHDFNNIQQLHICCNKTLYLPILLQAPKVGQLYEEIYTEKDVLDELFDCSIEELIKQGILNAEEAAEVRKKGVAKALI